MNAIQQISLKLQMGIDPALNIQPDNLRKMWNERVRQRAERQGGPTETGFGPSGSMTHPSLRRAG